MTTKDDSAIITRHWPPKLRDVLALKKGEPHQKRTICLRGGHKFQFTAVATLDDAEWVQLIEGEKPNIQCRVSDIVAVDE